MNNHTQGIKMNKLNKFLCAAAIATVSNFAMADAIIIETGTDYDAGSATGVFTALDVEVTDATSTLIGGACAGGLCAPLPTSSFTEAGSGFVDGLLPSGFPAIYDNELGKDWGLAFDYTGLTGDFSSGVPVFDAGGYVDLYYLEGVTSEQVLRLNIEGGGPALGETVMYGTVDYSWLATATDTGNTAADATTFFQSTIASNGKTNFYDIWADTSTQNIFWLFDFTIVGNNDTPFVGDAISASRTTDLNGPLVFSVPEPTSIAIIGLGLLGLAGASRRRR